MQFSIPDDGSLGNHQPFSQWKIRKLLASECRIVRDHLLRLDAGDRRLRFFGHVDDEYIVDYSRTIFADEGLILGCFLDGTLRAIGELHQRANLPEPAAEAAITVERPYQSNGIGTEVMRRLIEFARDRSIKTLHMACLLENLSMQQIAINLGGVLTCIDGTVEADIIA